ncbi:MAG: phytase [Ignavibacteriales bacterium]|nr:phytase [Ignavibacteriales bacterium]
MLKYIQSFFVIIIFSMCSNNSTKNLTNSEIISPKIVTDTVLNNSDDPAIWINKKDYSKSLIIGTDKGKDGLDGALFVFDLDGKEIINKTIRGLKRPNNVDIAYKLKFDSSYIDIAVCTERNTNSIRVFSLPELEPIDNGGIQVFLGDSLRFPMGVGLYTKENGKIYAIVSRKSGPLENYIWQYELADNGKRAVTGNLVRKFGKFSGKKEIEAIAVDNELGYVYYSDEGVGIRKYFADPDSSNLELALFTDDQFLSDIEGISIYKESNKNGFILVSDQQANKFHIFTREGTEQNPHDHRLVKIINLSTIESDGSDVTNIPLPGFPKGLFVAMSNPKVFHYYCLEDFFR